MKAAPAPYGLLAEFSQADALIAACENARAAGFRRMEAFSPFPLEELDAPLGLTDRRVQAFGIAGGVLGALCGFGLQVYANLDYPLNIGARPLLALPAFMIVTFLLAVLFACLATVLGLFILCRLPRLHHPLFDASSFAGASDDRFLLCLLAEDPHFELNATREWLAERADSVTEVWQ
ncbi:DUF3341 domain-containing protein [Pseudomonas sp. RIT-PI-S]|uniref:DUF3341 domain-containing protein n=1 Tax=Pseudomonas sp. RIT-PI-S TaxID=3035295 RepID=UPI0021DAF8DC|nr:DUF3341 domain-containing protein [Pseudomonas sp. RIT-PI-S]